MLNREKVNIRDPYILLHEGIYYLYGTRSATCWGEADGFDCYKSEDLENWEGPIEIFHRPEGFFAVRNNRKVLLNYTVNGLRRKCGHVLTEHCTGKMKHRI